MLRPLMEEHRWVVTGVPGLATYTVGFVELFDHPEICITGLRESTMYQFIRMIHDQIAAGKRFAEGVVYDNISRGYPTQFIKVHPANYDSWFGQAWGYNGPDLEVLQMVWTDTKGKFPWEEGFEEKFRAKQVLLNVDQRHAYDNAPHFEGCLCCAEEAAVADGEKPKVRHTGRMVH